MMPKEAKDPVALHNNLVALEDMDIPPSPPMDIPPSPPITRVGNHSPKKREAITKHTKQT